MTNEVTPCPDCVGENGDCQTCGGTGLVMADSQESLGPLIAEAQLPDALLLWMNEVSRRLTVLDEREGGAAPLLLGVLVGIGLGHWLF